MVAAPTHFILAPFGAKWHLDGREKVVRLLRSVLVATATMMAAARWSSSDGGGSGGSGYHDRRGSFTYVLDTFQRLIRLRMIVAGELEVDRHGDPSELFLSPAPGAVWYCHQDSTTSEAGASRLPPDF